MKPERPKGPVAPEPAPAVLPTEPPPQYQPAVSVSIMCSLASSTG